MLLTQWRRNALIPSVALVVMNFASMLSGTIVIEKIFALPGLGRLMVRGVLTRDFLLDSGAQFFKPEERKAIYREAMMTDVEAVAKAVLAASGTPVARARLGLPR